jgi:hypothetical protein
MLAHGLAIALWLGSLALYGAAFFFPEVHRRHDFFWSGVAAFYGLVLWFDAVQISPTELLGHGASLALLGWFGWQTLSLRRKRTPLDLQTPLTADSWPTFGRQLKQRGLGWLRATPLGRWLPEAPEAAGDPAIAVSEIRVSSLKEVDYEFVDELAVAPGLEPAPRAIAPVDATLPSPSSAAKAKADKGRSRPVPPAPLPPQAPQTPLLKRGTGLRAWLRTLRPAPPDPKREVIEIPPRPSPLDRNKAKGGVSKREVIDIPPRPSPLDRNKAKGGGAKREVIDIPPRPSPLDRNKAKDMELDSATAEPAPLDLVTIVDAAVASAGEGEASSAAPPSVPAAEASPGPEAVEASTVAGDRSEDASDTNWDDDTNWIDD